MPPMLTPSPGRPSHLEHLHNFHLHQVKGYSSKAAPRLDTFGKPELGSGIPVPSPFSTELPVAALLPSLLGPCCPGAPAPVKTPSSLFRAEVIF